MVNLLFILYNQLSIVLLYYSLLVSIIYFVKYFHLCFHASPTLLHLPPVLSFGCFQLSFLNSLGYLILFLYVHLWSNFLLVFASHYLVIICALIFFTPSMFGPNLMTSSTSSSYLVSSSFRFLSISFIFFISSLSPSIFFYSIYNKISI